MFTVADAIEPLSGFSSDASETDNQISEKDGLESFPAFIDDPDLNDLDEDFMNDLSWLSDIPTPKIISPQISQGLIFNNQVSYPTKRQKLVY